MALMENVDLERRVEGLEMLYRVGIALSSEKHHDRLIERILVEAKELCNADGGTLYLVSEDGERLEFAIMLNDTMGTHLGGTSGVPAGLPGVPLHEPDGSPNQRNVASSAATSRRSFNIEDAYVVDAFDFSGTKAFDERNRYRSKSFLTIPMLNNSDEVIGVLQLINAVDRETGQVVAFDPNVQQIVEALASQAAIALDNEQLLRSQRRLMEAFIQLIAESIDAKSAYTGGHCERVPLITEMLTQAACDATEGPFADFDLTDAEWYELKIAAWLHDCGKVTTPVHVMDKATKLETIHDRIHTVRARFTALAAQMELDAARAGRGRDDPDLAAALEALEDDWLFLERANIGGEYISDEHRLRIERISQRTWRQGGEVLPLLTEEEVENLTIARGTLSEEERLVINGHMVQTIRMLEALPFPKDLKRVPEYAGGHHETMDGRGYPKGIYAGDMSIPARIMAVADVFEALTAQDRPYKEGKPLSVTMSIMKNMKENNHLDPELLDLFVSSGVYRDYAEKYLPEHLIDEVDEAALLATEPKAFELPGESTRRERKLDFLPQYQRLLRSVDGEHRPDARTALVIPKLSKRAKTIN